MPQTASPPRRANLFRGLAYAGPMAVLGFSLPYLGAASIFTLRMLLWEFEGHEWIDFVDDIRLMALGLIIPGQACALMFFLAAILNFSPATRLGMIRLLVFVGLAILAGGFISDSIAIAFDLRQRTYMDNMWSDWRGPTLFSIWVSIPVIYTIEHTYRRIRREQMAEPES